MTEALPPTPPSGQASPVWLERLLEVLAGSTWRRLEQLLGAVVWVSLLLPFVTVKGCDAKSVPKTLTGWETLLHAPALLVPLYGIALLLIVWKARPRTRTRLEHAARLSWKAAALGLAAVLVWFGPFISFLFSSVQAEVGQWVAFLPWVPLWSGALLGAGAVLLVARGTGSRPPLETPFLRHGLQAHAWVVGVLLGLPLLAPLHPDLSLRDAAEITAWFSPVLVALLVGLGLGARALEREETWPLVSGCSLSLLLSLLTGLWAVNLLDPFDWGFLPMGACSGGSFLVALRAFLAWRWVRQQA